MLHRCQLAACGAINGVKGIIVLAKSVVTSIKHSTPVQHFCNRYTEFGMLVRWDKEFDILSSVLKLHQFLMELFTLPIYLGPAVTVRQ